MSSTLKVKKELFAKNCIYYGPIRFYQRRRQAPTLLTGRRSKFEEVNQEEQMKRNLRREKNRLLSRKLKDKRDKIQNELMEEIDKLQRNQFQLENSIEQLQLYKKNLICKLNHFNNQDPLLYLIHHYEVPLFFQQVDHSSFDTKSFLTSFIDEQSSLDDILLEEHYQ